MIGIVLWSDPADRKAVFWCEDQGDLAYFEDLDLADAAQDFFYAGDMVQFEVSSELRLRKAHDPKLLYEQTCSDLPDALRRNAAIAQPQDNLAESATVIPFAPLGTEKVLADPLARKA